MTVSGEFTRLDQDSTTIGHEGEEDSTTLQDIAITDEAEINNANSMNEKLLGASNESYSRENEVVYSLEKQKPNNSIEEEEEEEEEYSDKNSNGNSKINSNGGSSNDNNSNNNKYKINNSNQPNIILYSNDSNNKKPYNSNSEMNTLILDGNNSDINEEDFITSSGFLPFSQYIKNKNYNVYDKILEYSEKVKVDAQMNKKELILTSAFLFCFVSLGVCVGSLGPTLNSFTEHLDASVDQVGYFFSARGIGYFIGSLGCRFIDRFNNSNHLIGGGVVVMGVALLLVPVSKNIWLTAFIFSFCGAGAGFIDSGLNTLIVWVWQERVNPFMQLLHFAFGIGAVIAPLLVSQMVDRSLFIQYLVLSMIMLSSFFSIFFLKPAKPYISEEVHSNENGELSKGEKRLRIEVIVGIAVFLFFYVGAESGYGGWVCTYSIVNLTFSEKSGALLNSLFWGTFTISRLGGVFISLVLSPQKMVVLDTLGCFFFSILIILFPKSSTILWIGTAGLGISLASIFPTAFSLPANINIPVTGEATSYMVIGAVIGEVFIPWSIGMLQHHVGMHVLPWVVLFSLVISLVIYIMINLRTIQVRARERGQLIDFSFSNSISLLNQVVNNPTNNNKNKNNNNSNNNNISINNNNISDKNHLEAIKSINISISNIENKAAYII